MSKTVGKSKKTNTSKTAKIASAKTAKSAPKTTGKKDIVKTITSDKTSRLVLVCVIAIAAILIIALLASAVKNKKTEIAANLDLYTASNTCDMIVREDEGKRPASGSTIVVKDSKKFREMLNDYSYLKKFNLPEPKDFSEASYVYIYSIDSISDEGLRLGNVTVQNHNVDIEVKYDERKAVDCVNAHVFVVRVEDRDIDNANFSTVAD
jgi:hypothetical protein